jgi:hypothetical protein
VYGDPGCSTAAAADDLTACVRAAAADGVALRSFVFPRNLEGHHELLKSHGFVAYRGADQTWFRALPPAVRRPAHLLDQSLALTPPVSIPTETLPGLWNVPGSMILLPRDGVRRLVPFAARVAKARAGLAAAVRQGRVFHLWFHPFNFAVDRTALLRALDEILRSAVELRERGQLDILTMFEVAKAMNAGSASMQPTSATRVPS